MKHRIFTKSRMVITAVALVVIAGAAVFFLKPAKEIRHVVLISIDTCRSDYLSCYGYPRKTTPNIDAIAAEGILFKNAYSPVPLTLPSHSSMMTGTIPPYHGVHDNSYYQLGKSNVTLAEILKAEGFSTAAFISAFVLDSQFGLSQGFDTYEGKFSSDLTASGSFQRRIGQETTDQALKWLDGNKTEKSFLFLHYFDPHAEYTPPEPFRSQYPQNPYAGEIAYTDYCIGQIIEKLKEIGIYDSSLIIITSDHGEMLYEHGEETHGYFIYQSAIRVPLIFKLANKMTARKIDPAVGLVDIVPTVCSLLDIDPPNNIQGKDISRYFTKTPPNSQDRYLYCECLGPIRFNANSLFGLVGNRFKYIQTTRPELYDIVLDPGEMNNIIKTQPNRARVLEAHLKETLEQAAAQNISDSNLVMDAETRKRIESLGYISGAQIKNEFTFDQSREDPKDVFEFYISVRYIQELITQKRLEEAKQMSEKLIAQRPDFSIYCIMGGILSDLGEFNKAAEHFKKALKLKPDEFEGLRVNMVNVLLKQNKFNEAEKTFFKSRPLDLPKEKLHNEWAITMARHGQLDKATDHLKKAVKLNPESPQSNRDLARAFFQKDRFKDGMKYFKIALKLNPDDKILSAVSSDLTAKFVGKGKYGQAVELSSAVLEVKPDHLNTLNDLAWIKAVYVNSDIDTGKEAIKLARHACELTDYSQPQLLDTLAAAYAAAGQFADAIETAEKAIKLAANQTQLIAEIKTRLELYKQNKPYRQ